MSDLSAISIYALIDPTTARTRYVGKARKPAERLYFHCYKPRTRRPVEQWVRGLRSIGARPGMVILEETDEASWEDAERWWIRELRASGFALLNLADGGRSRVGYMPSTETRQKLAAAARKAWIRPGVREKYVAASVARWSREEEHARLSRALLGKKYGPRSEETKAKSGKAISAALRGRKLAPDHRAKVLRPLREHNAALKSLRISRECGMCGAQFSVANWEADRKYCSQHCYWQSKRGKPWTERQREARRRGL